MRNRRAGNRAVCGKWKNGSSGISVGLSSSGFIPLCTQMPSAYAILAKSDPATTPAPEEIPWQLLTIHFCAGAGPCGRLRRCYATFPPSVALRHIPPESDFAKMSVSSVPLRITRSIPPPKGTSPPTLKLAENRLWRSPRRK